MFSVSLDEVRSKIAAFRYPSLGLCLLPVSYTHLQTAWQTTGGMQVGSVWGHGAYQAPDWTADWLHRELTNWLDITANQEFGKNFADLNDEQQTLLKARLTKEYRGSKVENGTVVLSNTRLAAMEKTADVYKRQLYVCPKSAVGFYRIF